MRPVQSLSGTQSALWGYFAVRLLIKHWLVLKYLATHNYRINFLFVGRRVVDSIQKLEGTCLWWSIQNLVAC